MWNGEQRSWSVGVAILRFDALGDGIIVVFSTCACVLRSINVSSSIEPSSTRPVAHLHAMKDQDFALNTSPMLPKPTQTKILQPPCLSHTLHPHLTPDTQQYAIEQLIHTILWTVWLFTVCSNLSGCAIAASSRVDSGVCLITQRLSVALAL